MDTEWNDLNDMMEIKECGESQEDRPCSPYEVLQNISEEVFKMAGEALASVYSDHPGLRQMPPVAGHRRSQTEVITAGHKQNNGLARLKNQMQKAWR